MKQKDKVEVLPPFLYGGNDMEIDMMKMKEQLGITEIYQDNENLGEANEEMVLDAGGDYFESE